MKIYALSVVKNEADVIETSLKAAAKWADKIFVWDNGSTDGTWEKVLALADDVITPWKQDGQPFRDPLRHLLYNAHKQYGKKGDWWCIKLDADEIYADDPKKFLAAVPSRYHYVCSRYLQFMLTEEDITEYDFTGDFAQDQEKIRYFDKGAWAEVRFVRHRDALTWPAESPFPKHMGIVYPKLINMLHYQYRSPEQIQNRLDARNKAKEHGYLAAHVTQKHWQEMIRKREDLNCIDDNVDFDSIQPANNYLHKPHVLLIKRILHGLKILP
jgi:glycosyltransferase involved in cell wall biosynthesis